MSSTTAARFLSFLWGPFPVLHSRPPNSFLSVATRRSCLLLSQSFSSSSLCPSPTPKHLLILPSSPSPLFTRCSSRQCHFNAQQHILEDDNFATPVLPSSVPTYNGGRALLPWPEWSNFFDSLVSSGYVSEVQAGLAWNELVDGQGFSDDFIRAGKACLAFAHANQGLLWFLPRKDVEVLVENVSPFIFRNGVDSDRRMKSFLAGNTDHSDKPSTVDLMRYILSYVNKILALSEVNDTQVVILSVRKLFTEFMENEGKPVRSILSESTGSNRLTPGFVGKNIEMKRGDWNCPRCSFMNFARNSECLTCKESRPKRLLTGREWECPQCDFLNYGRNKVCLKCDCKNPGLTNPVGGFSYNDHFYNRSSGDEEKVQSWFTKLSRLESTSDANSSNTGENFPDLGPLRQGVGKSGTDSHYKTQSRPDGFSGSNPLDENNGKGHPSAKIARCLDEILGGSVGGLGSSRGRTGNEVRQNVGISSQSQSQSQSQTRESSSMYENTKEEVFDEQGDRQGGKQEKSEGWLHEAKDLLGASADDEFPDTMPMRKGENRIVVSKKKDRSLTSPLYKRRTATEQPGNNYVPFVPFPPGYFARDKQAVEGPSSPPSVTPAVRNPSHGNQENYGNDLNSDADYKKSNSFVSNQNKPPANQQTSNWNSSGLGHRTEDTTETSASPSQKNNVNQIQNFVTSQQNNSHDASNLSHVSRYPNEATSSGNLSQSTQKQSIVDPLWKGISLEGSAVKEPDPLDMSEEAKAERFFKRVAQIKDIKELSEIPDEDFPSIMPMRKGVNRFVISKRKTPLERRLAQSPYRRNHPPVIASDPEKQENE